MIQDLSEQPLSVAVHANEWSLWAPGSAVHICEEQYTKPDQLNHEVQLVGYNNEGKYWIVKNSWATNWGLDGFVYISADPKHDCGIPVDVYRLKVVE